MQFDAKKRKTFLRRVHCEGVGAAPLTPGSSVTVCSRQLRVLSPADAVTRAALTSDIKPTRC